MSVQQEQALRRLSGAIAIPTVSAAGTKAEMARFADFRSYLETQYPLVHGRLMRETVRGDSLLYTWKGRGEGKPFALLAHQDVVPVEEGTEADWTYPPFAGMVDEAYIWGRGASDVKCLLIAILEAVEGLLALGFTPGSDIYLAFGHNEEILAGGAESGAGGVAALLKERGVKLQFVLDEGGAVLADSFMGIGKPLAAIGVAEKGYCDFTVTVEGPGGHAAEPPADTAVPMLARLLAALKPEKARLTETVAGMLRSLGLHKKGVMGFILRHPRAFWPLLRPVLLGNKMTAAMLRSTCTATMLTGSPQANVLPQKASATFNARILPGDDAADIIAGVLAKAEKRGITAHAEIRTHNPPPKETRQDTPTFRRLSALSEELLGAVPMAYLVTGGTDSREFTCVTDEIYRFYPFALTMAELGAMHGTDERLQCGSFLEGIEFLTAFIMQSSGGRTDGNE